MSDQPDNIPTKFNVTVPTEAAEGHYADFASVWHNAETFILDFTSMTRPPRLVTDDTGAQSRQVDCQTVTRV
ncbi:DUF3467 domain-containing protein, partial [Nocardioides sp.]|uniref:DUF3467 domain-containing protein n=1 Tax=Nocardioides sp. TaxID=35761 RepID=UPI002735D000